MSETPPLCASCQRPASEHGAPHQWDALNLPSCPAPSLTGTYRACAEAAVSETPADKVAAIAQVLRDIRWSGSFQQLHHEVPTPHFYAVMTDAPDVILSLLAERDTLRAEVARLSMKREEFEQAEADAEWEALAAENATLRAEVARLTTERDALMLTLKSTTPHRDPNGDPCWCAEYYDGAPCVGAE